MFGLTVIDIVVIFLYFAVVIAIGMYSMRRIKNQEDYFLGGRRFGKLIQTFAAFGQATSSENVVGTTTTTFNNGASGIWSSLLMLFATPMYWFTSPWFRRLRLMTMGDFFEERYNSRRMAGVYAVIGCICMMANISIGLSAMTKTIIATIPKQVEHFNPQEKAEYEQALHLEKLEKADYAGLSTEEQAELRQLRLQNPQKNFSYISESAIIWIVCIIVMIYAVSGGLEAAFLTDLLQGMLIIVLSFMLLPFAYVKINNIYGGNSMLDAFRTIHERLPESFFQIFGSPTTIDFTWYYIAAIALMSTINVVVAPNMLVATGSAKDEYTARIGFTSGNFMKRFCTVFWGMFGLAAIVLYRQEVTNSDLLWGHATVDLIGSLNIGLVGLMIACLMAALMSTATCLMITASSLIMRNMYRPLFPHFSEKHYIFIGRVTGAAVVIGGGLVATQFDNILQMFKFVWEFNVVVAASFWLGMKWRRANRPAAWASIFTTMILFSLAPIVVPIFFPSLRTTPYLLKMTNPPAIVREFTAHQMDVDERNAEIAKWDQLNLAGKTNLPRPLPIQVGERFTKTDVLPEKSIFWTQGIKMDKEGRKFGSGTLNLELILFDKLGFDLSKNPYALNETIRVLVRTLVPFIMLILVALFTVPEDKKRLDLFYAKMKTPVLVDPQSDAREMELSNADPHRFDHLKIRPNSNWEFYKWDKVDVLGFLISLLVMGAIIGLLFLAVSIGA